MSDRKINVVAELAADTGVAVSTTITVDNDSLSNIEFENPEDNGVAIDFNQETGEVTFACNKVGVHEIGVSFIDSEDLEEIITITVSDAVESEEGNDQEPEAEASTAGQPLPEETPPEVIQAPVVETPPPVVQQAPVAPVIPTTASTTELVNFLNEYKSKMDLRAMVEPSNGIALQTRLYKMLMKVLSKEGPAFKENMDTLIGFVKANRDGVFNERGIGRFVPQLRLNKEEAMLFTRLTTMLIVTADVDHLGLVAQRIDFKFIGARLKNDNVMQRLQYYYNPTSE